MTKKRVLINGRFTSHHFAIRNVILNIAKQLSRQNEYVTYIVLNKNSKVDEFKDLDLKIIFNPFNADSALLNHLFTIFVLPIILLFKRIDVIVYPQICVYIVNPFCKVILYMHDLIEYHLNNQKRGKLLFRKMVYPYVCRHADVIVTVSNYTKKDLINVFHISNDKIKVAFDGKDDDLYPIEASEAKEYVRNKYGINDYIFYIGYLTHPQKNLIYLIDEFLEFSKVIPQCSLVFAGPKGKEADKILNYAKSRLSINQFKYIGVVPYEDLKYLYSGCEIFCFPSLFEGFGMPVLEAMACGAVVIASNRSSIPEILTDSRFLIDPVEVGGLSKKLLRYFKADNLDVKYDNIQKSRLFTWVNHGKVLRSIIDECIKK